LKAKPFFIKPNIIEAEGFLGRRIKSQKEIKRALDHFHSLGIRNVAITLGEKGAWASNGEEAIYCPAPEIVGINAVGCGDSFVAGYVRALMKKKSLRQCLVEGVTCGSANVFNYLPGGIDRQEIIAVKRKMKQNINLVLANSNEINQGIFS
ncbi:MAG: bifunctional hydroxymethylpyrimidine kinase/phosphomethylpyrimidine kinase, partial [Candidatus Omnitrophica bacterium]|nr:bifunctional hydroxymethylpyrimidine kinase/phosphomethylpyrimidine kinase [Candidatus Omnitrophota bacterium]